MVISSNDSSQTAFNSSSHCSMSQAALSEKLKGYYLVRSYAPDADPYAVISDLSAEEGQRIAVKNDPIRDADNYQRRLKTEDWLRPNAEASGVELSKATPVYFSFTNDPDSIEALTKERSPDKEVVVLPADEIDLSTWSFTMDDHFFANFDNGETSPEHAEPHPLHGRVLNAQQLVVALELYGYPADPSKNNFEAQMWASQPCRVPEQVENKHDTISRVDQKSSLSGGPGTG
jgi:hypothetical protein